MFTGYNSINLTIFHQLICNISEGCIQLFIRYPITAPTMAPEMPPMIEVVSLKSKSLNIKKIRIATVIATIPMT